MDDGVLAVADGGAVVVTAHVTNEGEVREAGFGGLRQSVDVETEAVTAGMERQAVRAGLRLGIHGKESDQEYDDGEEPVPMRVFRYGTKLRFAPSCVRRAIPAIPARLTIADTWLTRAWSFSLRPRAREWKSFPVSWADVWSCGASGRIAAS